MTEAWDGHLWSLIVQVLLHQELKITTWVRDYGGKPLSGATSRSENFTVGKGEEATLAIDGITVPGLRIRLEDGVCDGMGLCRCPWNHYMFCDSSIDTDVPASRADLDPGVALIS